jgi:hypothetical protein
MWICTELYRFTLICYRFMLICNRFVVIYINFQLSLCISVLYVSKCSEVYLFVLMRPYGPMGPGPGPRAGGSVGRSVRQAGRSGRPGRSARSGGRVGRLGGSVRPVGSLGRASRPGGRVGQAGRVTRAGGSVLSVGSVAPVRTFSFPFFPATSPILGTSMTILVFTNKLDGFHA